VKPKDSLQKELRAEESALISKLLNLQKDVAETELQLRLVQQKIEKIPKKNKERIQGTGGRMVFISTGKREGPTRVVSTGSRFQTERVVSNLKKPRRMKIALQNSEEREINILIMKTFGEF
jgi:hypothetical protein